MADDTISFGDGDASPAVLPDMTEAAEIALSRCRTETLQYAPAMGLPALREWIAEHCRGEGAETTAEQVLVVNGAKHGLDLVCRALLSEGDSAIVTVPTYFTGLPILRQHGAKLVEVAQDAQGLDVEALRFALDRLRGEGGRMPKLLYDMPDFHNPTGITMPRRRREALLELAAAHGIWVVEDSPYRRIRFEGEHEPCLRSLDHRERVISLGSFAKLLAPGLRVGWVVAAPELAEAMAKLKSDGGSCPLTQRMILEFCAAGRLPEHIERACSTYRKHRDRMAAALGRLLPDCSVRVPQGGYYLWLLLPAGTSGDELERAAAHEGVTLHAGSKFYAYPERGYPANVGPSAAHVRLCYSFASPDEIDEGVSRLARAYRSIAA